MKHSIDAARRYVTKAETVLRKAEYDISVDSYMKPKYVRKAGNFLWKACLVALEGVLELRTTKPSIYDYEEAVRNKDSTLSVYLDSAYKLTHLAMGYDGAQNRKIAEEGFEVTNHLIDSCEVLMKKDNQTTEKKELT